MLITEILNFVRVESGRMEYHLGPVSMRQAIADVDVMLCGAIEAKGLKLAGSECDPSIVAWADANRVRQILVNLVMNAVKYTSRDGGDITIECNVVGDVVFTHVQDHGVGIAAEKLEMIFEPFVQLSASVTDRQGGVGLGLAISRDLAHAMSGNLTADSAVGVGSEFTLSLPVAKTTSQTV
jgi:signal transduction histidine kinase